MALGNSAAPGTGSPGDNFLSSGSAWYLNAASVNNAGRTLFSAATDAATSPISSGIWHGVPGSLKLFAYDFHSIPCEHSAGTYIDIAGWDLVQCINDAGDDGQFVAMAEFNDGTSQRTGIFAGDARFNRQYVVAAVGDSVVDQNSTSYGSALSVGLGQLGISETVGHGLRTTPYNGYCTISACGVIPLWVQLSGGQAIFSRHLLPADVNGDHLININDYVAFGIAAATPDTCAADFDGDGLITVNDYVLFGNAYSVSAASCP